MVIAALALCAKLGAADDGWAAARPLVELVAAAPEPLKVETAKAMLGLGNEEWLRVLELTCLFLPVRDGLIHPLHKTVRTGSWGLESAFSHFSVFTAL